jgi:uroporphyrinogen III methyltransferase/synthase
MVYLVGAGPGDYKLISVKAAEYIKKADTIVYDRLADDRLLGYAKEGVELIYVGKASSNHTMKQGDINQLLVDKCREGKTVVRLKGGDPFVFGRGGEEALLLRENGLPFEIVPGITSAISVPAYAGIPVTHRAVATSFAVVTGHEDPTKVKSNMRWEHLATGTDTIVFLMGVENLPNITQKLMENGRSGDTPAAVIRWGTKPEQRVLVTTVKNAADDVKKNNFRPPAIFIVGDVVNLREKLAWFDNRPLFGKKILVTRSREQASELTEKLEQLGAECIEAPSIKIVPPESYAECDKAIDAIKEYEWIIFTSVNGVVKFFARLDAKDLDARALAAAKFAAIGSATAAKLKEYGIKADVVPQKFIAEGVVAALDGKISKGAKILLPRAKKAREVLPEKLREQGFTVDVVPVYETVLGDVDKEKIIAMLENGEFFAVTFTSSSTVKNLHAILGEDGWEKFSAVKAACIGPVTQKTCHELGLKADIMAEEYTIDGLVASILQA